MQRKTALFCALLPLLGTVCVPLAGCSPPDDGIPAAEKQNANRLDAIAKASGGEWNKLSADDKTYLVQTIAHGDEGAAKMMLAAKSGKLGQGGGGPRLGGPALGGPPGGPPGPR